MPLFTTGQTDRAFERFMKHQPNFKPDAPEADRIQAELDSEKEKKGKCPMIYRDDRHHHTFEKEAAMRPESISRPLMAALYLLTADRNLWSQVRDHISLRRVYVEDMRPKNLTGTSYVYFAAAKDILSGSHTIQLMEIADPALLSMKSYSCLPPRLLYKPLGLRFRQYGFCPHVIHFVSPLQSWADNCPTYGFTGVLCSLARFPSPVSRLTTGC